MKYTEREIKKGVKLHTIKTEKFKTNLIAVFLSMPITRENVTKNALISSILRRGCISMPTSLDISKTLENLYGATFDNGIDKTGDNQILKFYIETINDNYLPQSDENMLKISIEKLLEIVFNPLIKDEKFNEEYLKQEKENIKRIIEGRADNKALYATERCIEEMYKNKPFGLYKYGYVEDMDNINEKSLYEYYRTLINQCKIDIFVSGILEDKVEEIIKNNENIKNLKERNPEYSMPEIIAKKAEKENIKQESMDVNQGKLIIGLDLDVNDENLRYDTMIYNSLLGGSANSKLFQNVREKASLAYTAGSSYYRFKNNIFINCGIEIENYDKALNIIKEQIEDMKKGDFTDEEVENAKQGIIAAIKSIDDEQDTEITYFFGQELSENKHSIEEYMESISKVNKQNVVDIANKVSVNTVYFLRN